MVPGARPFDGERAGRYVATRLFADIPGRP